MPVWNTDTSTKTYQTMRLRTLRTKREARRQMKEGQVKRNWSEQWYAKEQGYERVETERKRIKRSTSKRQQA